MAEESWDCWAPEGGLANQAPGFSSVQFSSVTQSCLTLWDPMDCSTPGFPVHHHLLELTQTHVHWVSETIQPSHPRVSNIQVLQNKTNSINRKPGLHFGHRLMMISVCVRPGIINRNPNCNFWSLTHGEDVLPGTLFPTGTPDVLWHGTSQRCFSLDVGQNPLCWCILCSFYFPFLLMLVCWK